MPDLTEMVVTAAIEWANARKSLLNYIPHWNAKDNSLHPYINRLAEAEASLAAAVRNHTDDPHSK